jgi:hypothetical protein
VVVVVVVIGGDCGPIVNRMPSKSRHEVEMVPQMIFFVVGNAACEAACGGLTDARCGITIFFKVQE